MSGRGTVGSATGRVFAKAVPKVVAKKPPPTVTSTPNVKVPWGLSALSPPSIAQSDENLMCLMKGRQKKSPFEKHKEATEQKKKKQEEETALLFEEFVNSFAETGPKSLLKGKTFVRGGIFDPSIPQKSEDASHTEDSTTASGNTQGTNSTTTTTSSPTIGQTYVLGVSTPPKPELKLIKKPTPSPSSAVVQTQTQQPVVDPVEAQKSAKKRSTIDDLKEELKRMQSSRSKPKGKDEDLVLPKASDTSVGAPLVPALLPLTSGLSVPPIGAAGSYDTGDPSTTNLYCGNLSPLVTETLLFEEFGKYGPIGSIKIMWPRSEEERQRGRNCGFVSFMERRHAEEAKEALNGKVIGGQEIRIGWGKPVSKPPQPMDKPGSIPLLPTPAGIVMPPVSTSNGSPGLTPLSAPLCQPTNWIPSAATQIVVTVPVDNFKKSIIDRMARFVVENGHQFEQLVMEREKDPDSPLQFLFYPALPEHNYYRWRVFSLLQGDTEANWRTTPFQMYVGGPLWVPPPIVPVEEPEKDKTPRKSSNKEFKEASHSSRSSNRSRGKKGLRGTQRDHFENLLRGLTVDRMKICEAMAFALDNAEAAQEIVDIITESLIILATPIQTKIARLFLVSDILHNSSSSVPNASAYRTCFQQSLITIFEHLNEVYLNVGGRFTSQHLKEQVLRVLNVWEQWYLYPPAFLQKLEAIFSRTKASASSSHNTTDRTPTTTSVQSDKVDGVPMTDADEALLRQKRNPADDYTAQPDSKRPRTS
ncbi:U2-associated protein [Pelomyxa schiedti]|nr:U2-associated protein [Pelomyxa schiedti]